MMDDVWDKKVWVELKRFLPGIRSGSGSRVLLTTRLQHVARYASKSWDRYRVELLNKDQSWVLLSQRVFGEDEDSCPPQLEKAGKKIAEKCDGLPLMILAVAGILSESEKTEVYWESVAGGKNSPVFMAAYDQISEVLFPSYEYLPQHLKPCFLHVGVLPQKFIISRSELVSMWIAEGIIELNMQQPVERCCENYLGELIDHNVVMI